jgi:hypothetical protein
VSESEPHNSKLKQQKKEQTHKVFIPCVFALSVCYMGLGLAHKVFDRTNAMLELNVIFKFSDKNITHPYGFFCFCGHSVAFKAALI